MVNPRMTTVIGMDDTPRFVIQANPNPPVSTNDGKCHRAVVQPYPHGPDCFLLFELKVWIARIHQK